MSNLVNGSRLGESPFQRGNRQGGPLSPFLFLIDFQGFNCLMNKAISLNLFERVAIGHDKVLVNHLQFADDTVIISEASITNVMLIKGILRLFEISYSLRVNFSKSYIHGNIGNPKLAGLAEIIGCKIGSYYNKNADRNRLKTVNITEIVDVHLIDYLFCA
ncbi:uncharacterized protein LOC131008499 [Salvia miltiorrhiza]|uniref:uncharacterized protein LOC131008499 n=1 Tax=Salvia miltiorrhiza TaxID=226208 RepID=UPI0025AD7658|nr:uncharacterized protein LOC131008499 [Salvia miltiorrhiza]